jgi:alkanesulfonate monooxygenase SsuD/methylene tetrahydromethanopterin reductase-like flavin-dependent oxidoreductase (luciferase family)
MMWRRADEYGLYAGYTYDHLSWRSFREKPWFTMVPTLVAAAGVTKNLRLGPLVTSPNFRHPLVLAKDLLALDDISNGRVIIGVGSGGTGFDATVLGQRAWSPLERHERFVEFTRALDVLLREPFSTIDAEFYPVVDSRQIPGPVQLPRPPIVLSALGPKGLALAAELADGWVSFGSARDDGTSTFDAVARQVNSLDAQLAAGQRDTSSMERIFLDFAGDESPLSSFEAFVDWAGRYRSLGFTEVVVHWPIPDSPYDYDVALFERIATEGRQLLATF